MNILGVDCSTSTIGLAIVTDKGNLVKLGYIKPEGDSPGDKVADIRKKIHEFVGSTILYAVAIEKPEIMHSGGGSSGQTVALLNWFNGAAYAILLELFGLLPVLIAPGTARKIVIGAGRFPKPPGVKASYHAKKCVFAAVSRMLPDRTWETGPRGGFKMENYDQADAYVVAMSIVGNPSLLTKT